MKKPSFNALEDVRKVLSAYARGEVLGTSALRIIDNAIADESRRGKCLPPEPLGWESERDVVEIGGKRTI